MCAVTFWTLDCSTLAQQARDTVHINTQTQTCDTLQLRLWEPDPVHQVVAKGQRWTHEGGWIEQEEEWYRQE